MERKWLNMWLSLLSLLLSLTLTWSSSVSGCGGFVKLAPSFSSVDKSKLSVGLFTKPHYSVKESVDFSPSNGYFFVPIYDDVKEKQYVLKVIAPKGWTISPEEVAIDVDDGDDMCVEDIVFNFVGFAIQGTLTTEEGHQGPKDRTVTLKRNSSSGDVAEVIQRVRTDSTGSFVFLGVAPGHYTVQMERHDPGHKCEVDVTHDNVQCQPFVLTGVEVEGALKDERGRPLKDVQLELKPLATSAATSDKKSSRVSTDENGRFAFSNVSRGEYQVLIPDSSLTFQPGDRKITVEDNNVLDADFKLKTFTVRGKIEAVPKEHLKGLQIKVETVDSSEEKRAGRVDPNERMYTLSDIKFGRYSIVSAAPKMSFESLVVSIDQLESPMPVLRPKAFEVDFYVEVVDEMYDKIEVRCENQKNKVDVHTIDLNSKIEVENKSQKVTKTTLMLPRDQIFNCQAKLKNGEEQSLTLFEPKTVEVKVDKPIEAINFALKRLSLKCKLKCLGTCPATDNLKVELSSSKGQISTQQLSDGRIVKKDKSKEIEFSFDGLLPNEYQASIIDSSNTMCFREPKITVDLKDNNKELVSVFEHEGYKLQVLASHSTTLLLYNKKKLQQSLNIERGASQHCIKTSLELELATEGCQNFDFLPSKHFKPGKDAELQLQLRSLSIEGSIRSDEGINQLVVDVRTTHENDVDNDESNDQVIVRQRREVKVSSYEEKRYIFSFEGEEGEELVIEANSEAHFFQPIRHTVVLGGSCDALNLDFEARRGVFFEGAIHPAVEGVAVLLLEDNNVDDVLAEAMSDDAGHFKLGPLRALPSNMALRAEKEGYFFEETNANGVFKAHKYAGIHINIRPMSSSSLSALPSAVVSVSGGSYRDQAMTDEKGRLSFSTLSEGEYFIQAFVKEWELRPKSQLVQLKDGQEETIVFEARRVAFAVTTKVVALNDEGLKDVVVVAKGLANSNCSEHKEDSVSQSDGTIRLGGLKAYCTYRLEVPDAQTIIGEVMTLKIVEEDQLLEKPIKVLMKTHANLMDLAIVIDDGDNDNFNIDDKPKERRSPRTLHMELTHSSNGYVRRFDLAPSQSKIHVLQDVPMTNESGSGFYTLSDDLGNRRIVQAHSPFMTLVWDNKEESRGSNKDDERLEAFPLRKLIVALGAVATAAIITFRFKTISAWIQQKNKND